MARQKIRDTSKPSNIPIVMLTAKSQEVDKVRALELGADDYLTKPIAFEELGARIKALIRRSHGLGAENSINISGLSINPSRHLVEAKNKHVELGVVEFKLLYFLMKNNGRYFDRQSLIDAIWGQLAEVDERTVDATVGSDIQVTYEEPQNQSQALSIFNEIYDGSATAIATTVPSILLKPSDGGDTLRTWVILDDSDEVLKWNEQSIPGTDVSDAPKAPS